MIKRVLVIASTYLFILHCFCSPSLNGHKQSDIELSPKPLIVKCRFLRGGNSDFYYDVLKQSLTLTEDQYGAFQIDTLDMRISSTTRKILEIRKTTSFNIDTLPATKPIEEELLAIPFPLFRGLFGLRVIVVHPDSKTLIEQCKILKDLRRFTFGQGKDWSDALIFQYNHIPIVTGESTKSLYSMLSKKRFDAMHRSYVEISYDLQVNQEKDFQLIDSLYLYYPYPNLFFVSKENKKMAERILSGLNLSLEDGSYDTIMKKHFGTELSQLSRETKRVILLENPLISEKTYNTLQIHLLPDLKRLLGRK